MGDGYRFRCLLKQPEIDVQSTSNRKLPNFYEKVTDFLWKSYRISKWRQNSMLTEAWRDCHNRTIQTCETKRLFIQQDRLFMQKRVMMWYAYIKHWTSWFRQKPEKRPLAFVSLRLLSSFKVCSYESKLSGVHTLNSSKSHSVPLANAWGR